VCAIYSWDLSVSKLLQSIADIPERNEHRRAGLLARANQLISEARQRVPPDPIRYNIARSLLCDVTKHIPRLSYQHRATLNIVQPLVNPMEERQREEERKRKEAEKANPWV
jgi:hypothetical protein